MFFPGFDVIVFIDFCFFSPFLHHAVWKAPLLWLLHVTGLLLCFPFSLFLCQIEIMFTWPLFEYIQNFPFTWLSSWRDRPAFLSSLFTSSFIYVFVSLCLHLFPFLLCSRWSSIVARFHSASADQWVSSTWCVLESERQEEERKRKSIGEVMRKGGVD